MTDAQDSEFVAKGGEVLRPHLRPQGVVAQRRTRQGAIYRAEAVDVLADWKSSK